MRTVVCQALGRDVSALGFGCASLGSRISEGHGLRALGYALERGVTWFDVAPSYGDGGAESMLGRFLAGRRDSVVVCARVGGPRPPLSLAARLFRPLARAAGKVFPFFPGDVVQAVSGAPREPLRADMIEASVRESLRRLRTDYVDVLCLDEPSVEECANEAILRELQRMIEKGCARTLSIAGTPEAIAAGAGASPLFRVAQCVDNLFEPAAEQVRAEFSRAARPPFLVTHGIFGRGAFERVLRMLATDGGRLAALASQLGYGPPYLASELVLDYAFARNPEGVVLAAMGGQSHINLNCARASRPPRSDVIPFVRKFILSPQP
jgi:aryl-alcohol dehydrogenase-like predicted oxidoreductase